jgi:hypothetical protein
MPSAILDKQITAVFSITHQNEDRGENVKARNIKNWSLFVLVILIVTLVLPGCSTTKNNTIAGQPYTGLNSPSLPIRVGDINIGPKVAETTQSVDSKGGTIAVSKPGDPLNGFVVDVPPSSYSGNLSFKVSSAPITNQTFGSDITPVSPMIYVDNGGAESNDLMYIRVPVNVPAGYFAMGFIYDAATKQLEGMPLIATDAESVTVGTRHFSNFFISMISDTLLSGDIDSGFRPGVDDWQFTNRGSLIAPIGHCEGQSITALWYYCTKPDGTNARLCGRYDNNGNQPATPTFWQDDSLGYRFASVAQADIDNGSFANIMWVNLAGKDFKQDNNGKWQLVDVPGISNKATWDLFAYSIKATHEPQLVCIRSNAGGGHAMIVYEISDGNLYVADPNYPGNTKRVIEYANGQFKPYNSGANADEIANGNGKAYENIAFYAKTTVLPWDTIAQHWTELKDGTIGKDSFPGYKIQYINDQSKWVDLTDDTKTPFDAMTISVQSLTNGINLGVYVYRDGQALSYDAKGNFDLIPGTNKLGIEIIGKVGDKWEYVDFQYMNVVYNQTTTSATPGQSINAEGKKTNSNLPEGAFGTPDNPYTVTISGTVNADPNLKFEGVEYYSNYASALNVMAFVYSIPSTSTITSVDALDVNIKFSNPVQTKVVRTTQSERQITTSKGTPGTETTTTTKTLTWKGWGEGKCNRGNMKGADIAWSNGGNISNTKTIMMEDVKRNGEGLPFTGGLFIFLNGTFDENTVVTISSPDGTKTNSSNQTYAGYETVVIRLVKR